jgi:hypothetical protein
MALCPVTLTFFFFGVHYTDRFYLISTLGIQAVDNNKKRKRNNTIAQPPLLIHFNVTPVVLHPQGELIISYRIKTPAAEVVVVSAENDLVDPQSIKQNKKRKKTKTTATTAINVCMYGCVSFNVH